MELMPRPPEEIILHHSYRPFDTDEFETDNMEDYHVGTLGWGDIGYHFVVENIDGRPSIIFGRPLKYQGAHTLGHNDTIGVCVVGDFDQKAPDADILDKLRDLIEFLKSVYKISKISGHRDYSEKTCPGNMFPLEDFREGWPVQQDPLPYAYKKNNLIIKQARPTDIYLLNETTTTYTAPAFDGMNGVFFGTGYTLLGVAYDRETMYCKGVSRVPPRACLVAYKDGTMKVEKIQDLSTHDRLQDIELAIGGFSSDKETRAYEKVAQGGVPEGVKRPRSAVGFKNGIVYLITSSQYNYTLEYFEAKMELLGFEQENWLFVDGGGSTQCYYYNNGSPIYKYSTRAVPLPIGVRRQ
jgi:hypothetical protein